MDLAILAGLLGGIIAMSANTFSDFLGIGMVLREVKCKPLWSSTSFPEKIADIENSPAWRKYTNCYYVDSARADRHSILFAYSFLAIVAILFGVTLTAPWLRAFGVYNGISLYDLASITAFISAMIWHVLLVKQWKRWKSFAKDL